MSTFLEYKSKVVKYFDECISFAKNNGYQDQIDAMTNGRKRVEENKLVILTCGEMRRGKSTMLSALLEDEDLFPVDIEVTTCLATMVCWGKTEKVTVTFEDGTEKLISRRDIQDYATEKRNEGNHKNAKWIVVETPNPKLENGLTFIDTPGVGSLNPLHTEVTYSFLPRADIVLFVSDATAPLTDPELVFLRGVKKHCENFLFVLTKKDMQPDYEQVIESNKQKIEEFAGIPKNKICYIPVSGTMRLASLTNGSERMAKSSNFECLESVIWNTVNEKRADIIIAPPLGELASCLKEIEKHIHIKMTGLSDNAKEQAELKQNLQRLQADRQRLLSDSSTWQMDIQSGIKKISFEQVNRITQFRTEATEALDKGLADSSHRKKPELLLNEIVLIASTTANEINDMVFEKLGALKLDFETNTKLNMYVNIVKGELSVDSDPSIAFDMPKGLDKAISKGRNIGMKSMGGAAIGGLTLAVGLGVLSLAIFGPAAVIADVMFGAQIGALLGGAVGTTKGAVDELKQPGMEAIPQIRSAIMKYINQTYENWRNAQPVYIDNIQTEFIKSLRESIKTNQQTIDRDIAELQNASTLNVEGRTVEKQKITAVKASFSKLVEGLNNIKGTKGTMATKNKQKSNPTPEASATPEAAATPEATATPEAATTPEAAAKPESTTTPEATAKPEAAAKTEAAAKPETAPNKADFSHLED